MSEEAKVLEMPAVIDSKPKSKVLKTRIEAVLPTSIVDVWRLVEQSLVEGKQTYPDTTEDSREAIRSHLFAYMQNPMFVGLMAKVGRRPAGVVLGHVMQRSFGSPSRYAYVYCFWVDPYFRNKGVGQALWADFTSKLKKAQIFHWESNVHAHLEQELQREAGVPVKHLLSIVGGRT